MSSPTNNNNSVKRHTINTVKSSGIKKPAIRRLARRAGIHYQIESAVYPEVRKQLKMFMDKVLKDAVTFTEHARRKTVTKDDIKRALDRNGRQIYGF